MRAHVLLCCAVVLCCVVVVFGEVVTVEKEELRKLRQLVTSLTGLADSLSDRLGTLKAAHESNEASELFEVSSESVRRLESSSTVPALSFQHPDARVEFFEGSTVSEEPLPGGSSSVLTSGSVTVDGDVNVAGSVSVSGTTLNLGVPLTAAEDLDRGDVVSLAPAGGVAKGFGMQLSSSLTSLGVMSHPKIARLSERHLAMAYLDENSYLQVVYYDSGSAAAEAPVAPIGTEVVSTFTIAAISDSAIVVCFKKDSSPAGHCMAARYTGVFTFGSELELTDTATYESGVLTHLHGVEDRLVLVYSMATDPSNPATEAMKAQLLSVSDITVATLQLPRSLVSSRCTHISAASLTDRRILIAYSVDRDATAEIRELYFRVDDNLRLYAYSRFPIGDGGNFKHLSVTRLDDSSALLLYREADNDNALKAVVVDASTPPLLDMGPETTVNSGSSLGEESLAASVVATSPTRAGVAFVDAGRRPLFVDIGLFGRSVVVGRAQDMARGSTWASSVTATYLSPGVAALMQQPLSVGGGRVYRATLFGGPTMLGLVANPALAGEEVTVVVKGALDAYSDLRPGAPYYARYDGGYADAPDEVSGVSAAIVGKAITSTTMLSLIGSDGETNKAQIASVEKDISGLAVAVADVDHNVEAMKPYENNYRIRHDLPVWRWAQWSTHSRRYGWYCGNRDDLFAGVHPSDWGDGSYRAYQIRDDKNQWMSLFNKKGYGGPNAVICSEEWYYADSTTSKHCGALFRIRNAGELTIRWTIKFYYSSYGGWGEYASVTLNGANTWESGSDCGSNCHTTVNLDIPPGRTSTVIVISGSNHPSTTRTNVLAFYDDTLTLPDGLEYLDDLHYNRDGGWES